MRFTDRKDAGERLASRLEELRTRNPVVLGLPRGGVPVAFEVARELGAPLDIIVVRKLGVPSHPELGFGAIGEGGARVLSQQIIEHAGVRDAELAEVERAAEAKLRDQALRLRGDRARVALRDRTVIIVDDGIATGGTAAAACQVARELGAARVVLAVPVAPSDALKTLRAEADEVVCLSTPSFFSAVGEWYQDFSQTTDEEVISLLRRAETGQVHIDAAGARLTGDLTVPHGAPAIVVFAHGSGSSRHSPRNRAVASALNDAGLGTLLLDLLTVEEERDRANVFDIEVLARRLTEVTRWLRHREAAAISLFGASTGAAAALRAAAQSAQRDQPGQPGQPSQPGHAGVPEIAAVVSRGGRPDLAGAALADVRAPTLLIVGGADPLVLDLNRQAQAELRCENRLAVVPGATHLFEEPGALEEVAELARDWFTDHAPTTEGRMNTAA